VEEEEKRWRKRKKWREREEHQGWTEMDGIFIDHGTTRGTDIHELSS
jgi:hypothetical protein